MIVATTGPRALRVFACGFASIAGRVAVLDDIVRAAIHEPEPHPSATTQNSFGPGWAPSCACTWVGGCSAPSAIVRRATGSAELLLTPHNAPGLSQPEEGGNH
jgi:hypothetical protein